MESAMKGAEAHRGWNPRRSRLTAVSQAWDYFLRSPRLQIALLAVIFAGWIIRAAAIYRNPELGGLFRWIGIDFGAYLAQASVFVQGRLGDLYSFDASALYRDALAMYASQPAIPLRPDPVPYPPLFAWLMTPFLTVSPPIAFAIWTILNAAAGVGLAWRVAFLFPPERRLLAGGLVLVSSPVVWALWFGQVQLPLALAFGEAYLALRRGRDLRAGAWLGAFALKPQYLLLILPVLLWKRRWRGLTGFTAASLAILVASVLVGGLTSVRAYAETLVREATATSGTMLTAVSPEVMVNWRALMLDLPIGLSDAARLALTLVLTAGTIVIVLMVFRGPWRPAGSDFAGRMTLLAIATVLAAYHSHIYGVTIIAVPLADFLGSAVVVDEADRALRLAISGVLAGGILAPWLWFVPLDRGAARTDEMVLAALIAGFLLLFVYATRVRRTLGSSVGMTPVIDRRAPA
jgi:glycosyl transferase family 87